MVGVAKKARDLRTKRHIKVDDAAAVIAAFQWWANRPPAGSSATQWAQDVAEMIFAKWSDSPVVLRVDQSTGRVGFANTHVPDPLQHAHEEPNRSGPS